MDNYIKICSLFGQTLDSREAATLIFDKSKAFNSLHIDFSEVNFMSRSFADQFVKESCTAKQKGIEIGLENLSESLKAILSAVEKTQKGHRKEWCNIPTVTFYNKQELYEHLQTI